MIPSIDISRLSRDYSKVPAAYNSKSRTYENIPFEDLKYLYLELNLSCQEISDFLGIPAPSIWHRLWKENLKKENSLRQECRKRTSLAIYGTESPTQSDIVKQKISENCLKKFGVSNPAKLESVQKKMKQTCLEHHGVDNIFKKKEYIQQKTKEKYGVHNVMLLPETRQKLINTNLKKYGAKSWTSTEEGKKYISDLSPITKEKEYKTKKEHNTFQSSLIEKEILGILQGRFPKVINPYKDSRYPFNCDFYIPSLDLFIEYQGIWMHGGHPYNPNDPKDQEIVKTWEAKSKELNFKGKPKNSYQAAIGIWTERDVLKRETARKNYLNYKEFFNMKQFLNWFNNIEEEV